MSGFNSKTKLTEKKKSIVVPVASILVLVFFMMALSSYYSDLKYAKENGEIICLEVITCTETDATGEEFAVDISYKYNGETHDVSFIDDVSYEKGELIDAYIISETDYRDMEEFIRTDEGMFIFIDDNIEGVLIFFIFIAMALSYTCFAHSERLTFLGYIMAGGICLYGFYFLVYSFVVVAVICAVVVFVGKKRLINLITSAFLRDNSSVDTYGKKRREIHDDNCNMDGTQRKESKIISKENAEKNMVSTTASCLRKTVLYMVIMSIISFVVYKINVESNAFAVEGNKIAACGMIFAVAILMYGLGFVKLYAHAHKSYNDYREVMQGYMEYSREMVPLKKHTMLFYSLLVINFMLFLAEVYICVMQIIK